MKHQLNINEQKIVFYVLIRSWNTFSNFDRCVDSVLRQNYKNYKIIFVDDCSEYTPEQKQHIKEKLKDHIVVFNKSRKYSLRNAYENIHKYTTADNAVIVNLDGDDRLYGSNVLDYIASIYQEKKCLLTYGECFINDQEKNTQEISRKVRKYCNIPYSKEVKNNLTYREQPFLPLHPRTWKADLFKKINKEDLLDEKGHWLRFCEDMAIFFPMLEMAGKKCFVIKKPLYIYNQSTGQGDLDINFFGLIRDEIRIRKKPKYNEIV